MIHRNNHIRMLLFTVLVVLAITALGTVPVFADTGAPPPPQPPAGSQSQSSSANASSASGSQTSSTGASSSSGSQTSSTGAASGSSSQTSSTDATSGSSSQTSSTGAASGSSSQTASNSTNSGTSSQTSSTGAASGSGSQTSSTGATSGSSSQTSSTGAASGSSSQTASNSASSASGSQPSSTGATSGSSSQTTSTGAASGSGSQTSSTDAASGSGSQTASTNATTAPNSTADTSATPAPDTAANNGATTASTAVVTSATPAPGGIADNSTATPAPGGTVNNSATTASTAVATDTAQVALTVTPATLSQLPAGTNVVVLNAAGASIPLASQAASNIIATGDPMWCPTGVAPGGAGCTASTSSFNGGGGLLSLISGKTVAGTIWIEASYVGNLGLEGGPVTINGGSLGTTANFALTLQGGWNGTLHSTTTNPATPSLFTVPLSITNWLAPVTLNDIEVKNIATAGTAALTVTTSKNIALTRVHVHDNSGTGLAGASLDNSGGTGSVSVASSEFNTNYGDNLDVNSNGTITLTNIIAQASANGSGAVLNNHSAFPVMGVTVTGDNSFLTKAWISLGAGDFVNSFNKNYGTGLYVSSMGTITLSNITASNNKHSNGVDVTNDFIGATAGVTLTGVNIFNNNNNTGLLIASRGPVSAASITANSNASSGSGVEIDNNNAVGAQPVTLTGTNVFKYNNQSGLYIFSNGQITLNNLLADYNAGACGTCSGVYLINSFGSFTSGVTITGIGEFTNNTNNGLQIYSNGIVYLLTSTLTASNNGASGFGSGVYIDNSSAGMPKAVTISGTSNLDQNHFGLFVNSKGAITANSLSVTNTVSSDGALLTNDNPSAVGGVTLTGVNTFNTNYLGNGLKITSFGAITLSSVSAGNNGIFAPFGRGIYLNNSGGTGGVTLTGTNNAGYNGQDGVLILTKGAVSINSLSSTYNGTPAANGSGLTLDNSSGTGGVTLTGTNAFNGNYSNGLALTSRGPITLGNITAVYSSHGYGAIISNTAGSPSSPQAVTISGTNYFYNNHLDDLNIATYGAITLSNVAASGSSTGSGAVLDNHLSTALIPPGVTLSGTNQFYGNAVSGLFITSRGLISASNLQSNNNTTGYGAYLDNHTGTGGVTLSGVNQFGSNPAATGLFIQSHGAVTLASITAGNNGNSATEYGLYVDNSFGVAQPVMLTGTNQFIGNYDSGLFIKSTGLVTLYNITADNNATTGGSTHGYGLEISNVVNTAGVTLYGTNDFSGNYSGGLVVYSRGPITLNNVSANGSSTAGDMGAMLDNTASGTGSPQGVTINGTNDFSYNNGNGLDIQTYGPITLSNVNSTHSTTGGGAILDNHLSTALIPPGITLNGANNFDTNQLDGIAIQSRGMVTLSSVDSQYSTTGSGATIDNHFGNGGVTLSGTNNFSSNGQATGLYILTNGAISLNQVTANFNGNANLEYGVYLDNSGGTQPVTLTGTNQIESNFNTGLYILSKGLVTLYNVTANSNGSTGGSVYGYGLEIPNTFATAGVTLNGTNNFDGNYSGGLTVTSKGPITLYSVQGESSLKAGAVGAMLDNTLGGAGSPQNVAIYGTNNFGQNNGDGLDIKTYGTISLTNVTSDSSTTGSGAVLDNYTGTTTPKGVTLTGTNDFSSNHWDGLDITSKGLITASSVTASINGQHGASFDNHLGTGGVTLSATNVFSSSTAGYGLYIHTSGAINTNNVTANNNGTYGATLDNTSAGTAQLVTLTGTNQFSSNKTNGIYIRSNGPLTLYSLAVVNNDLSLTPAIYGADIDNTHLSLVEPVIFYGTNTFNSNHDIGLNIVTLGAITMYNVGALNNTKVGVSLTNTTNGQGVILYGTNTFSYNSQGGLAISSWGAITLNNLTSWGNTGTGVQLDNHLSTSLMPPGITLNGINLFAGNTVNGLSVQSKGAITLNNVTAHNNTSMGVSLDNGFGTAGVTLTGTNTFQGNGSDNLYINSKGLVSLTKVRSDGSISGDGVNINTTGSVTFTCGSLTNNSGSGLYVSSSSNVTLTGVVASGNGSDTTFVGVGSVTQVRVCPLP